MLSHASFAAPSFSCSQPWLLLPPWLLLAPASPGRFARCGGGPAAAAALLGRWAQWCAPAHDMTSAWFRFSIVLVFSKRVQNSAPGAGQGGQCVRQQRPPAAPATAPQNPSLATPPPLPEQRRIPKQARAPGQRCPLSVAGRKGLPAQHRRLPQHQQVSRSCLQPGAGRQRGFVRQQCVVLLAL